MENLKLENFSTGYANNFIIKSIDLSVKSGEWLGVIGPNGSGKSTLIKGICRIIKPFQGSLYLKGKDINRFTNKLISQTISFLPQQFNSNMQVTVKELVALGRSPYKNFWDFDLNEDTMLTIGARYDDFLVDSSNFNDLVGRQYVARGGNAYANPRDIPGMLQKRTVSDTSSSYKLALQHYLSDDVMVYALYATGNKPGGNSPNESGDVLPYDSTDSSNIELGLRSTLAGGRVLLNATLFQHDAKDAHNSMIYGTSAITNTIDYTHTGLEIQSRYLLGENTSLDINVFALDSEIGDENLYDPANPFALSSGTPLALFTDEDGLGLFFANALGSLPAGQATAAALYAGLAGEGVQTPFCNWGLFIEGLVAKCQGVFVVNPAIIGNPGFAQVVRQDLSGNRMPATRELDYNISLNQAFTTANGVVDSRLTMAHKGQMYASLFNTERSSVPEQRYFDLITTYRPNNGDWYVGVYGKNLANKRPLIGIDRGSEVEGSVLNATIGFPRTYGISFGIDF